MTQNHHDNFVRSSLFISRRPSGRRCCVLLFRWHKMKVPTPVASGNHRVIWEPFGTLPGRLKSLKGTCNFSTSCNLCFKRDTHRRPWHFPRGCHSGHEFSCSPGCLCCSFQGQFRPAPDAECGSLLAFQSRGHLFLLYSLAEEPWTKGADWRLATERISQLRAVRAAGHTLLQASELSWHSHCCRCPQLVAQPDPFTSLARWRACKPGKNRGSCRNPCAL